MRVVIYTRVSTEEQAGKDKGSHDDQIEKAKRAISEHGWDLINIYQDTQKGHGIQNRLQLIKLLEDAKLQKFDLVIVRDADRLSRDRATATIIREQLKDCLVQVYSIDQPREPIAPEKYDPDEDDSGVIYEGIADIKADLDIKSLRRKVKQGAKNRALKGQLHDVPYGYDKAYLEIHPSVKLKVTENPKEANIVRSMYDWYGNKDFSFRRIATELNTSKIPSPTGKLWSSAYIHRILSNPVYLGFVRHNHRPVKRGKRIINSAEEWILIKGTHPAIINKEVFQKVQERIKQKKVLRGRAVASKGLLIGLVKCGYCGKNLYYKTNRRGADYRDKHPNSIPYFDYYCATSSHHGSGTFECKGHIMGAKKLEELIIKKIENIVQNPQVHKKFLKKTNNAKVEELQRERGMLLQKLQSLKTAASRHWEAYEREVITLREYSEAKEKNLTGENNTNEELTKLEDALKGSLNKSAIIKKKKTFLKDFSRKFSQAPLELKRKILQGIIQKIIVKNNGVKIIFVT